MNGDEYNVAVKPADTLLHVLRDALGLTGTKSGCELGDCGACTVLVDDEPMNSCLLLAASMEGKAITTIEGLEKNGELHPLQRSFINNGAIQCGFCTPAQLLCAKALLDEVPDPGEDEVAEALAGVLCRCTGYVKPIEAVMRAAAEIRGETLSPYTPLERAIPVPAGSHSIELTFRPTALWLGLAISGLTLIGLVTLRFTFCAPQKAVR